MIQTTTLTDSGIRRAGKGASFGGPPAISTFGDPYSSGYSQDPQAARLWSHCGFQRILFMFDADSSKQIVGINAIIDVYYVGDPDTGGGAVKIGRVSYSGKLVQGASAYSKPEWKVSMASTCLYNQSNSADLPELVRQVGPGAFMTAVIQTLLGTEFGMDLMGLKGYSIPDCR
jgi:hypothetical protein